MQRTGRKGHAMFRMVVQESRLAPTSGRVVAQLGHYDPHAKVAVLDKEKAGYYLGHGAQPSDRVIRLLLNEGVELPKWVRQPAQRTRAIRNPEKLRRNQPKAEAETPEADQAEAETAEA